jgi:hypothetical protein
MWLTALAGCEAISGEEAVDQSELPSQKPIIQAGRPVSAIAQVGGNRGTPEVGVEAQDRGVMSLETPPSHQPHSPWTLQNASALASFSDRDRECECSHRHPDLSGSRASRTLELGTEGLIRR